MRDVGEGGRLVPGTRLIGKYEIVRQIGRGGFGLVYEALHLGLRVPVAIKVLRSDSRQHPQTLERFRREAWTSAQIASPHVVRVMDVDVLQDGSPFIVMELLRGHDLETELNVRGRLPLREAVGYVLQAASAIAEAHARGVVHRDLKPNNLFLVEQGGIRSIKVLDFGLSKIASELSVTKTSSQLGTPLYMSPEQIRSAKHTDARSDIWSLGVILYRMLALRTPFDGQTVTDLMVEILGQPPPELTRVAPNVPPELARVVMRTLCKDPADRYRSVAELASALAPFGPPGAFVATGAAPVSVPQLGPSATLTDSSQDTPVEAPPSHLRSVLIPLGVALGIVVAAVGLRAWWISAASSAVAGSAQAGSGAPVVAAAPAAAAPAAAAAKLPSAPAALAAPSTSTSTSAARPEPPSRTPRPQRAAPPAPAPVGPADSPAPKRDLGF